MFVNSSGNTAPSHKGIWQRRLEKEVINKTLKYALITMVGLAAIIYITTATFADSITLMFNSDGNPKLQEIAITGLRLYFTSGIFAGFNIIISIYFTSTENPAPAQLISLIRGFSNHTSCFYTIKSIWNYWCVDYLSAYGGYGSCSSNFVFNKKIKRLRQNFKKSYEDKLLI